jgi:exosortase/archaeosortase family protein
MAGSWMEKWQTKPVIFRFLVAFGGLLVLFYAFYFSPLYEQFIMPGLLRFQAGISSAVLSILGYDTRVDGDTLFGERLVVSIRGGCDGVEATALFMIAVLALPGVASRYKWQGIIVGGILLFILNIFRIVGLYLSGVHLPSFFEFFHLHGGVIAFLLISVVMWLIWVQWVMKKNLNQ